MKKYVFFLMVCFLANHVSAQDFFPPSPDATGLIRMASVGVNNYTGTPAISIPLAQLTGRELGVSASLSYNSAANRVQDVASSEGLGWNLSVGGMITRIVRGVPDDLTNGFCTPNKSDPEPDMFIFSFGGRSGKFVLSSYGTPVLYPYQDLVIKSGICGSPSQKWEIIDENGTRYLFGTTTSEQESTTSRLVTGGASTTYVSTWHLSKIISANGTDEITFYYTSSSISYVNYFFTKIDYCNNSSTTSLKDESLRYTINTKYPSSIYTSGGTMSFSWNSNREDLAGAKSLTTITVSNKLGNQTQKLRFEYGYFQVSGCSTELCKRLRLDRIYDLSADPLYSFQYNTTTNLPARDSKNFDHWGYYNNNTYNSWIPADPWLSLSGASRNPDVTKMQANLLTRINQRGGSYQLFNYEANTGMKDGNTITGSGSRIKSITTADGKGNTFVKNYSYTKENTSATSGILFRLPNYSLYLVDQYNYVITMKRYSHSYSELLDVNGLAIGYSRVVESVAGNGKTVFSFTNYDTNPDLGGGAGNFGPPFASIGSLFWERGNPKLVTVLTESDQKIAEEVFEYKYDNPIKAQVQGSKSLRLDYSCSGYGTGYNSITGYYTIISRPFTLTKKTSIGFDQLTPSKQISSVIEYTYDPNNYQLLTTTTYNGALPLEKYVTTTKYISDASYAYDKNSYCQNQLTTCQQQCYGNPSCLYYCQQDYDFCMSDAKDPMVTAISKMRTRHMVNVPVEEQTWFKNGGTNKLLGAKLYMYGYHPQNANILTLGSQWSTEKVTGTYTSSKTNSDGTFDKPTSFKRIQLYNSYDPTTGRLLQETGRDGIQQSYVWDHNSTVVKTQTTQGASLQQTVNYEYKPLVGITKVTDSNGLSASTEYDALGRARIIKDHDGNIVQRKRYHYAGETPGFVINATKMQANVNESITFTLADIFVPTGGTYTVAWDMGDGRVYNDNRTTVTLSYPTTGTKNVSVTLTSNEYPATTRSIAILINSPLQVQICLDGPQEVDVCHEYPAYFGDCTVNNTSDYDDSEFTATVVPGTGCTGNYTYKWEHKKSPLTSWTTFGTQQTATFYWTGQVGDYSIRCTVTDACNKTAIAYDWLYFYESQPNCGYYYLNSKASEIEENTIEVEETMAPVPMPPGTPAGTVLYITTDSKSE